MVVNHYFTPFLPFLLPINFNHAFRCTKSSTHSLPNWFWSKIFSFLWIHDIARDHVLWASNCTNEWRTASRVIFRFDIDVISSWWRGNHKKCTLILKLNPLELSIIAFFRTFISWWFCYKSTPFLVMNLKLSMKVFIKLKTPPSSHGLQFLALNTIIGCAVQFVNCFLIARRII